LSGDQEKLLTIWDQACELKAAIAVLDKLPASRAQRAATDSVADGFRYFQYCALGELLNLYDIPAEERSAEAAGKIKKAAGGDSTIYSRSEV
jgi:hypothetical protein